MGFRPLFDGLELILLEHRLSLPTEQQGNMVTQKTPPERVSPSVFNHTAHYFPEHKKTQLQSTIFETILRKFRDTRPGPLTYHVSLLPRVLYLGKRTLSREDGLDPA